MWDRAPDDFSLLLIMLKVAFRLQNTRRGRGWWGGVVLILNKLQWIESWNFREEVSCVRAAVGGVTLFGLLSTASMAYQWKITILVQHTHPRHMASLGEGIAAMQRLQKGLKAYSCVRTKIVFSLCCPQKNVRVLMNGQNTPRGLPWQRDPRFWWCGLKPGTLQLWQPPSWFMHRGVHWKVFTAQMYCSW